MTMHRIIHKPNGKYAIDYSNIWTLFFWTRITFPAFDNNGALMGDEDLEFESYEQAIDYINPPKEKIIRYL